MDLVASFESGNSDRESTLGIRLGSGVEPAGVATAEVKLETIIKQIKISGWLRENDDADRTIAARVPGRIEKLYARYEGQELKAGDPILSIYSPTLLEWEREYNLLYRQSQMSHSSRITAEHARLLKSMRRRLIDHGLQAGQIDQLPNKPDEVTVSEILSPVSGMIVKHFVEEGDYVEEGDPLMRVVDLYRMWFEFDVYEGDLEDVATGQRVSVDLIGERRGEVSGVISFIDANRSDRSRSARARVELRNATVRVRGVKRRPLDPNTYAEGWLRIEREGLLAVPRSAVLSAETGYRVYVAGSDGRLTPHTVTIGFKGDERWEVTGGLTNGSRVVIEGAVLLDSHLRL